ncbi:MAG: ATP-binding protein [Actinobacteria bacterium]|nr:ATP-binding protein [Actinomycetota bacterium]
MKKTSSRYAAISIFVTTILSSVIGGFATIDARNSDLQQIDQTINLVAERVNAYPAEAISAAILTIDEESLDLTLVLVTKEGDETVINESHLIYSGIKSMALVKKALTEPISIDAANPFRLRAIEIAGGDYLIVAADLQKLDTNLKSNLKNLIGFTIAANAFAIFISILLLRRHDRGLDAQALQRMQRFLGDASHELRTPLTVIKGYSEMLSKGQMSDVVDRARAFSRVNSEIERMENLIHDLLLLAELGESRPTTFEEIDLTELTRGHVNDFELFNTGRTINVSLDESCELNGSREHLNRLIQNCLSNIVRHTPADAAVSIALKSKGKKVQLVIEDGGPGLPESAYRSEIAAMNRFDPSRSRDSGGSGLGMSIIAAIVQEHNGKLELRKSDLGGLAVDVEFTK